MSVGDRPRQRVSEWCASGATSGVKADATTMRSHPPATTHLDQVLSAAQIMCADAGLRFVLVGDGPEKKSLLQQAEECGLGNVSFLDPHPAKDIPALLAAAEIVVVTLKTYLPGAVPSKLYEAMASGKPVVMVAGGEPAEIVCEHRAGIVVEPGDVVGLVQAIRTLRGHPELRQELGANGRRAARQYFNRARIASCFIEYLETNLHR